jgi:hypothetical protein
MGQCKWCGKSGFLFSVNENGICPNCQNFIKMDIQNRIRILFDSLKIVKDTKNIDTFISRLDLIIQHSKELIKYEEKGIPTTDRPPSEIYNYFQSKRDSIIVDKLETEYISLNKSLELPSVGSKKKVNDLNKLLLKSMEIKPKLKNSEILSNFENKIKRQINNIQFNSFLEEAQKAEFKNNKKGALSKYYEALYFLQHDLVDDSLQNEQISKLKTKIIELGGEIKF